MFGSKRGLFSTERGSTTSWLAGITSAALLIGTVALPAVATGSEDAPVQETQSQPVEAQEATPEAAPAEAAPAEVAPAEVAPAEVAPAEVAPAEVAPADVVPAPEDPATEEAPTDGAILGDGGLEDEAAAEATDEPASEASAAPAADVPAVEESTAPAEETPSAATADGSDSTDNAPPVVQEYVPGLDVEVVGTQATVQWPDFGPGDAYVVQMENADGTWRTLGADVEEPTASDFPDEVIDNEATLTKLTPGTTYTVRVVSAETEAAAEGVTEDATIAGPGRGAMVRIAAGDADASTSQDATFTVDPYASSTRNDDLPLDICGLDIVLVLDSSGSIGTANAVTEMKSGVRAILEGVKGSGSRVAMVGFSTDGYFSLGATPVTTETMGSFETVLSGYRSAGWTNWKRGLEEARKTFTGFGPDSKPDMVVVLTDGNPNRVDWTNTDGAWDKREFDDGVKRAVDPAIVQANLIKAAGIHMLGIGVFDSAAQTSGTVRIDPIKAITGPDRYPSPTSNFRHADFMIVNSFGSLASDITSLFAGVCASLDKSATPDAVATPGGTIDYTVKLTNSRPDGGQPYTSDFTDELPAEVTLDKSSIKINGNKVFEDVADPFDAGQFRFEAGSGVLTIKGVSVPADESRTITYTVTVKTDTANGTFENFAEWNDLDDKVTHTVSGYKLTLVARYCDAYGDIQRNRADNNLRETFANLGVSSEFPYGLSQSGPMATSVTPSNETEFGANNCAPLDDWQFTLGTGISSPPSVNKPSDPSIVTNPFDAPATAPQEPRTNKSIPELDASGAETDRELLGAVTVNLTEEQITRAKNGSLWVQGGKAQKGANYTGKQVNQDEYKVNGKPKYAFATLRCVVDNLNGDNVEYVKYGEGVKHGFCYAYYVDYPDFGRIIVKKEVPAGEKDNTAFQFTGTTSFIPNGAFSLKADQQITFERAPVDADNPTPWVITEDLDKTPGWLLKDLICTVAGTGRSTVEKTGPTAEITLKAGDTVTCTYTNTKSNATIGVEKSISVDDGQTWADADTPAPGPTVAKGSTVKFKYVVTNTGNVPLADIDLTDNKFDFDADDNCTFPATLAVQPAAGSSFECIIERDLTEVGQHTNTATAEGSYREQPVTPAEDDANAKVVVPDISVDKSASPLAVPAAGGSVTYTVVVTNDGDLPVTLTSLDDDKFGNLDKDAVPANSEITDSTCELPQDLKAANAGDDDSYTCTFKAEVARSQVGASGRHVNVVTATAYDSEENEARDDDDATVGFYNLTKESVPDTGVAVDSSEEIVYTLKVSNTGLEAMAGQTVTDVLPVGVSAPFGITGGGIYDAVTRTITWDELTLAVDAQPLTFTYKVTVLGTTYGQKPLVNEATWVEKKITRSTEHPVKALKVETTQFCYADAPFYSLDVQTQNLDQDQLDDAVTVRWVKAKLVGVDAQGQPVYEPELDNDGNPVWAEDADGNPYVEVPMNLVSGSLIRSGSTTNPGEALLWAGAGPKDPTTGGLSGPIDTWPGWKFENDTWIKIPTQVRPAAFIYVKVNPEGYSSALYPPATTDCNPNPPAVPEVEKTAVPPTGSTVIPNQEITYTVTLTNKGGQELTSDLTDTLPKGVTFVEGTATRDDSGVPVQPLVTGTPAAGQTLRWPNVTVPASTLTEVDCEPVDDEEQVDLAEVVESEPCGGPGKVTFTYKVTVNADVADKTVLVNKAKWADIEKSTTHNVTTQKGVTITKRVTGSKDFVRDEDFVFNTGTQPGKTAVYRFDLVNTGRVPVTGVTINDDMFIGTSTATRTSTALDEGSIKNCRVGSLDSTVTFEFGTPIPSYTLPVDDLATTNVNEGAVSMYCDLPIPSTFTMTDAEFIFNSAKVSGSTPLGPVNASSNTTSLRLVKADVFPIKSITDADGTNPRAFDNLAKPTVAVKTTFALKIENRSKDNQVVTSYDYFENQSLGLSDTQRRAIFDGMKCTFGRVADLDAFTKTSDEIFQRLTVGEGKSADAEFFSDTAAPRFVEFGQTSTGGGAGTFYTRSRVIGLMRPGQQVVLACTATLTPGEYNLVNTLRMVANPVAGVSPAARSIMAIPANVVQSLSSLVRSATTEQAATGAIDLTDSAGVVLGVPTAGVPGLAKSAVPVPDPNKPLAPGDTITYTVVASNKGGSEVTGPVVDTLPTNFTVDTASVTAAGGTLSADGKTITWNVTLAPGASQMFTYKGTVSTTATTGNVVNTVTFQNITKTTTHPVAVVAGVEEVVPDEEVVAAEEDEDLADTGAGNVGNLVGAALLAMLAGGLMVTFGRRRREE